MWPEILKLGFSGIIFCSKISLKIFLAIHVVPFVKNLDAGEKVLVDWYPEIRLVVAKVGR